VTENCAVSEAGGRQVVDSLKTIVLLIDDCACWEFACRLPDERLPPVLLRRPGPRRRRGGQAAGAVSAQSAGAASACGGRAEKVLREEDGNQRRGGCVDVRPPAPQALTAARAPAAWRREEDGGRNSALSRSAREARW
jgi:hypothetical protein